MTGRTIPPLAAFAIVGAIVNAMRFLMAMAMAMRALVILAD